MERSCNVYINRREAFSRDRERGHNPVREGSRLFVHLAKVTSGKIVFEITADTHPIEIFGGVFEAIFSSDMGYSFIGDSNNCTPDVASFIGCFIGTLGTVSTVILPSSRKRFVNKNPTGMVDILTNDVIERIRGCGFLKAVIPLAFEVLEEGEDANIKGSRGLVRERIIGIDRGIRDG